VAFAVEACIANSVVRAVTAASAQHPLVTRVVVAGGVASNQHIRARVEHRLQVGSRHLNVEFAPARYASDSALGPATIARQFLQTDQ
jgi:N6-L-threonylcarbamoyladenine synthase